MEGKKEGGRETESLRTKETGGGGNSGRRKATTPAADLKERY